MVVIGTPPLIPPPPNRMHKGAVCVFQFSRVSVYFLERSLGKISLESLFFSLIERIFVVVIASGNQYPRQGGGGGSGDVYPLILWEWGGGGGQGGLVLKYS